MLLCLYQTADLFLPGKVSSSVINPVLTTEKTKQNREKETAYWLI